MGAGGGVAAPEVLCIPNRESPGKQRVKEEPTDTSGKGGMDDLINQIKKGGVKLKSTKSHSIGGISRKPDVEEKEKPADAVQEMKSILATMKRGRHGRLKPSEISQGSKFRTKTKKEKSEFAPEKENKTEFLGMKDENPNNSITNENSTPSTFPINPTEDSTVLNNQTEMNLKKTEEADTVSNNLYRRGSSVEESFPSKEASNTPKFTCPSVGENDHSSREVSPPVLRQRSEDKDNSSRLSQGRVVTTTTIFLRNSQSPSKD